MTPDTPTWEERAEDFWHEEHFAEALHEWGRTEDGNPMQYAPEKFQKFKSLIRSELASQKQSLMDSFIRLIKDKKEMTPPPDPLGMNIDSYVRGYNHAIQDICLLVRTGL